MYTNRQRLFLAKFPLVASYKKDTKESGNISVSPSGVSVHLKTPEKTTLRPDIYLITPSGKVMVEKFGNDVIAEDKYLEKGSLVSATIPSF